MIEISGQYGDQASDKAIWPFHIKLNELFKKMDAKTYFKTVKILSIIFRVSGNIWKFEGEGPERLKYLKNENVITVDLLIPENRWKDVSNDERVKYISKGIRVCFDLLLTRAKKAQELIDEKAIRDDFEKLMDEFERTSISK